MELYKPKCMNELLKYHFCNILYPLLLAVESGGKDLLHFIIFGTTNCVFLFFFCTNPIFICHVSYVTFLLVYMPTFHCRKSPWKCFCQLRVILRWSGNMGRSLCTRYCASIWAYIMRQNLKHSLTGSHVNRQQNQIQ